MTRQDTLFPHEECNSAYYWRTVFQLDSTERQFIETHDIERLYIRMFDVVYNIQLGDDMKRAERVVPNATITFRDSVPVAHVVPTVYITIDALRTMAAATSLEFWVDKILTRVMNMCSYNEIKGVDEIQLDCDWTETTRDAFFNLCRAMKEKMSEREDTKRIALSSTIRLHQLKQKAPPVDRGVLMIYNTGSFINPNIDNSILSYDDVEPYLKYLKNYSLHLDFAYPIYSWGLIYKDGQFKGLLHDTDISHLQTMKLNGGRLKVLQDGYVNGKMVDEGDIIRLEDGDYETIARVKNAIDGIAAEGHSNILYHLSSGNIQNHEEEEINAIYE